MPQDFSLIKLEGFEWDKSNIAKSWIKHKVTPGECEEIFFNTPILINKDTAHSQKENRFEVLGQTKQGKLLFLVFTFRKNKIRVISARNQNKKERLIYRKLGGKNV